MRWRGGKRSSNVEDRRGQSASGFSGGGGLGLSGARGGGLLRLLPMVFRLLGFKGTAVLLVGVLGYGLITGNLGSILGALGGGSGSSRGPSHNASQGFGGQSATSRAVQQSAAEKELVDFVSVVLADTEQTWAQLFRKQGKRYKEPKLVLFRGRVKSACGLAQSAMGPFYCPGDQKVYLDLGFFDDLKERFKAPGDFAQAYVIAHEVGHHVQTLLGISKKVHTARERVGKVAGNRLSVKQELQADCFAGVWANHANRSRQLLEQGDVEEGLTAATAIGDDRLQRQARGVVTPDSFTHGSSAQRVKWFRIGLASGKMSHCDTFRNFSAKGPADAELPKVEGSSQRAGNAIASAFKARRSDVQVQGVGIVKRVLADDTEGLKHQKFILAIPGGPSVLVAHNIDLSPRLKGLRAGDRVEFYGEYEWNERGGVVHWTHDDPGGRHINGWLKYKGVRYH